MAVPLLQYDENYSPNSLDLGHIKKKNKISCLKSTPGAAAITVIVYVVIFYAFDLSPSSVVSTTNFWFLISNTLLLIIATDLTAFLKTTSYQHNPYHTQYLKNVEKAVPKCPETTHGREEPPEKVIGVDIEKNCKNNDNQKTLELEIYKPRISDDRTGRGGMVKKCARSNSDRAALMAAVSENEEKMVLQRTLSEGHEVAPAPAPTPTPTVEENELESITDEELNRRVEEFIRKFNREIRLQAAGRPAPT